MYNAIHGLLVLSEGYLYSDFQARLSHVMNESHCFIYVSSLQAILRKNMDIVINDLCYKQLIERERA